MQRRRRTSRPAAAAAPPAGRDPAAAAASATSSPSGTDRQQRKNQRHGRIGIHISCGSNISGTRLSRLESSATAHQLRHVTTAAARDMHISCGTSASAPISSDVSCVRPATSTEGERGSSNPTAQGGINMCGFETTVSRRLLRFTLKPGRVGPSQRRTPFEFFQPAIILPPFELGT